MVQRRGRLKSKNGLTQSWPRSRGQVSYVWHGPQFECQSEQSPSQAPQNICASCTNCGAKVMSMSRKKGKRAKIHEQYTFVSIHVESYEVSLDASVNSAVYSPQYTWSLNDGSPLYEFKTYLTIRGICISPKERAGEIYDLTMYSADLKASRINATLEDAQKRDEFGSPQYRTYRGKQIPVYDPPKGLSIVEKVRGQPRWTSWLPVQSNFATDLLTLLDHQRPLFLAINERKVERTRWLQHLSIQTTNPEEE